MFLFSRRSDFQCLRAIVFLGVQDLQIVWIFGVPGFGDFLIWEMLVFLCRADFQKAG